MVAAGGIEADAAEQVLAQQTVLSVVEYWDKELQSLAPATIP